MSHDEGERGRCFMSCDPPEGGGEERFYIVGLSELTIYGHTCDQWTRENYPEDLWATKRVREQGNEFGCWHSAVVPDGELGSQDGRIIRPLTYDQFELARKAGWPEVEFLTAPADMPLMRFYDLITGEIIYDSLRDTPGEGDDASS